MRGLCRIGLRASPTLSCVAHPSAPGWVACVMLCTAAGGAVVSQGIDLLARARAAAAGRAPVVQRAARQAAGPRRAPAACRAACADDDDAQPFSPLLPQPLETGAPASPILGSAACRESYAPSCALFQRAWLARRWPVNEARVCVCLCARAPQRQSLSLSPPGSLWGAACRMPHALRFSSVAGGCSLSPREAALALSLSQLGRALRLRWALVSLAGGGAPEPH